MGQILLVRHGQAQFGSDDYDRLTELGRSQARLLGGWLAKRHRKFDAVVTGSMKRHRQTAEACLMELPHGLRPKGDWRIDHAFDEYDADEVVLRHRPEFADSETLRAHIRAAADPRRTFQGIFAAAMQRWMCGDHDCDYREPWNAFQGRCVTGLKRIVDEAGPSARVVVFTSGGPIAAICQNLLGLNAQRTLEVNSVLVNCATTGLLYQPHLVSLSFLNNFAHLEDEGNPQMVTYR